MGKYIKEFRNHVKYEEFINNYDIDLITPNISYCNRENETHYNAKVKQDYSKRYLTFSTLEDTTFSFSTNNIDYSLDNGKTWETLVAGTNTPTINAGKAVLWKASGLTPTSSAGIGTFSSTGKFNAKGNIMSLVSGDNFQNNSTLSNYQFYKLFYNCVNLNDVKNLILPATTMTQKCYSYMFYGCNLITVAPNLPAMELNGDNCYEYMFYNCTSLKYLKPSFISYGVREDYQLYAWLNGTSNGLYIKDPSCPVAINSGDDSGSLQIPITWTLKSSFIVKSIDQEGIFTTTPAMWILIGGFLNTGMEVTLNNIKFTGSITSASGGTNATLYTFEGISNNNETLTLKQRYFSDRTGSSYTSVQYKITGINFQIGDVIEYEYTKLN